MDDLALLTEMGDRTPLPSAADLAPARERLMSAIDESPKYVTDSARVRRRFLGYGTAVVGLAAAITGVFAIGGFGVAPPKASAAEVLQQAAAYARSLPDTLPRPDQFVYVRTEGDDGVFTEMWRSADGTRDGLSVTSYERNVIHGCKDGKTQAYREADPIPGVFEPCEPSPAYDPAMPTDTEGMRTYLAEVKGADATDVNDLGKTVWEMMSGYVPPRSLAAMFEVLAETDGIAVVEDATDVVGRHGIGVTWSADFTVVFDAETYALLGDSEWQALVSVGVVDEVGQLP
jgi:hypothetical protein